MTSDPNDGGRPAPSPEPSEPAVGGDVPGRSRAPLDPARLPPLDVAPPARPVPIREPPSRPPLAVPLAPTAPRPPGGPFRPGPRRADDRRIAAAAIVLAAVFLLTAIASAVLTGMGVALISPWLPLHLALAGGASTAIAGVMPFFVSALAAGAPAPRLLRGGAVGMVALGAALVAVRGIVPTATWAPVAGGCLYLGGIATVAWAVQLSGRAGLMVRRPVVTVGYVLALVNVGVGGLLGTLSVAGWLPVLQAWDRLKPAHAWANLVGFVSLVIVATLLHFLPTVLGGRIVPRRSAVLAVMGIAVGTPLVVLGLIADLGPVAGGGALVVVIGAAAVALETGRVIRDRGRWTSDAGWHRFASLGLVAGVAWFLGGIGMSAWLVLSAGASAGAWSTALVGAPLVIGWVLQVLMASWTHLVPSIGPGGPVQHALQRKVLGRLATPRLLLLNGGCALMAAAWPAGVGSLVGIGGALVAAAVLATVGLTARALRVRD
jgi:nitrite reductase (NO-forming)